MFQTRYKKNKARQLTKIHFTRFRFCVCPKPGPRFLMSYVVVFFVLKHLRRGVIIRFGNIDDHHF